MSLDYSGHIPEIPKKFQVVPPPFTPFEKISDKSSIQNLIDEMIESVVSSREKILRNLIENPGVVATFGEDFLVEFGDVEIITLNGAYSTLDEYRIKIVQKWRIIRREENNDSGTSLGRDSRGEV